MLLKEPLVEKINSINSYLESLIPNQDSLYAILFDCSRYTLLNGGKRLRPLLTLLVTQMLGQKEELALQPACALEIIHSYSLIHDDLPCMDNDDLRRGKPTLHKAFNEALAVLTGDYLLTYAFEILSSSPNLSYKQKNDLCLTLAKRSGSEGMIGGQVLDISCEGKNIKLPTLEHIHNLKTGALMAASMEFGGIIANASDDLLKKLKEAGLYLGLTFQIVDDILDNTGTTSLLGKPAGSDANNNKSTYISLLGKEKAQETAQKFYEHTLSLLRSLPGDSKPLEEVMDFILKRNN
jgi:geranylgeranyl diphosphate synthase, type II